MTRIFNHQTSTLSHLDLEMVKSVPSGGNWKNIPKDIPSKRLENIRQNGGRTTYYGRLKWDKPSYTITTYFNRPGNGCNIHPDDNSSNKPQHRLISLREAARLQSFPDSFRFYGPKTSIYKQIGNAVPPLLAYSLAKSFNLSNIVDLFCGCGGLSKGFEMAGYQVLAGCDTEKHALNTWEKNHNSTALLGDLSLIETKRKLISVVKKEIANQDLDILAGGPPCQGFSTAGWRIENDPRNNLWANFLDLIEQLNPKYFLIENVVGILSMKQNGKKTIELMTKKFNKLGYFLEYKILKAEEFGVPQLRRRAIIVGSRMDMDLFQYPETKVSEPFTVYDAISDLPRLNINDGDEELDLLDGFSSKSKYQKWCRGIIDIESLFDDKKSKPSQPVQTSLF